MLNLCINFVISTFANTSIRPKHANLLESNHLFYQRECVFNIQFHFDKISHLSFYCKHSFKNRVISSNTEIHKMPHVTFFLNKLVMVY